MKVFAPAREAVAQRRYEPLPTRLIAVAILLTALAAAVSVAVVPSLGYDAWAWMVWARELASLNLNTTGGPSFKPFPVIIMAPFGSLAPMVWLFVVRLSMAVALLLAWLVGHELAGKVAGAVASLSLGLIAMLGSATIHGSSEPVMVMSLLAALLAWLRGRPQLAVVLLAVCTLIRPEGFPLLAGAAVWAWRQGRVNHRVIIVSVLMVPSLWLGLDWMGSGSPLHGAQVAQTDTPGNAGHAAVPGLELLSRAAESVVLPTLIGFAIGMIASLRGQDRRTFVIGCATIGWVGAVAVATQAGFSGAPRYLAAPTALACLVAGSGWAAVVGACPPGHRRRLFVVGLACMFVLFGWTTLRTDVRLLGVAHASTHQLEDLTTTVDQVPGHLAQGGYVGVNPWVQSALAWHLRRPLREVHGAWSDRPVPPRSVGSEALILVGPVRFAGRRPRLTNDTKSRTMAANGSWRALVVSTRPE